MRVKEILTELWQEALPVGSAKAASYRIQAPQLPSVGPKGVRTRVALKREAFRVVDMRSFGVLTLLFVEQEPQVRLTKWHLGTFSDRALSFPRMLFVLQFHAGACEEVRAFFSESFRGVETHLCHTILPNGGDLGWVCIGNETTKDRLMQETAGLPSWEAKADVVLDFFWNRTHFNDHVIDRLKDRAPKLHPNLASLASWEAASRREPNFVNGVTWEFACTVGELLARVGER
jgi:hypothetical protein